MHRVSAAMYIPSLAILQIYRGAQCVDVTRCADISSGLITLWNVSYIAPCANEQRAVLEIIAVDVASRGREREKELILRVTMIDVGTIGF